MGGLKGGDGSGSKTGLEECKWNKTRNWPILKFRRAGGWL